VRLRGVQLRLRSRVRTSPSDIALESIHVTQPWFKSRSYKHLDAAVSSSFADRVTDPQFVAQCDWSPLIRYEKITPRYKPLQHKTILKKRPIMIASHRDACILSKYAHDLTHLLEGYYQEHGLDDYVIAYRKLGRANYDFSSGALEFALAHSPCTVMCFDISGFFDNLDHSILKRNLKSIYGKRELPDDWYKVFRHITRFSYVEKSDLLDNTVFCARANDKSNSPIATIGEIKAAGIKIKRNANSYGIPQGTPISAVFSNLYMLEFDCSLRDVCVATGGLYQRYSDDILIICSPDAENSVRAQVHSSLAFLKLQLSLEKTEEAQFDLQSNSGFQYLGFEMSPSGAVIRASSISRQWRKMKRSIRRTREQGRAAIQSGTSSKVYTKKLWKRFSSVGSKNFSSYARRAAGVFKSHKMETQIRRLERAATSGIRALNGSGNVPKPHVSLEEQAGQ